MRDEVLEFLRQNQGGFVSGQDMSEACHVSRTAIWKHIKALRQKGYKIESYTKRGYRLLEEPDLLSPLAMKQILKTDVFGKRYVYMDTTESTNLEARYLAQQGAEKVLLCNRGTGCWPRSFIARLVFSIWERSMV